MPFKPGHLIAKAASHCERRMNCEMSNLNSILMLLKHTESACSVFNKFLWSTVFMQMTMVHLCSSLFVRAYLEEMDTLRHLESDGKVESFYGGNDYRERSWS